MINTIEQAKSAAKRMHAVLRSHHDANVDGQEPKLSQAQSMLAHGLGMKDWHGLETALKDGAVAIPSSRVFIEAMLNDLGKNVYRPEWVAIELCDAMLEPGSGQTTAEEAIATARPSTTLLAVDYGWFPGLGGKLASKTPRGGTRRIDGMPVRTDVRRSYEPEDLGLRILDGVWHVGDAQGVAAVLQGVCYAPEWELEDSEAILAADAESDIDADTVSAIVQEDPDIFMLDGAVFHLRAIEVRPDLRGRGIARRLAASAMGDLAARTKTHVVALSYDPKELLDGTPARRVAPSTADALPGVVSRIMAAIVRDTDVDDLHVAMERSTDAQNMIRIGHLVSGGDVGSQPRLSAEQAESRMSRARHGRDIRLTEAMGSAFGIIQADGYPEGRHPSYHQFPNIVMDPPADLLDLLGEGATKLEIVTAPKRLNQVNNWTDEPGSYRVHYDDGEVVEIDNDMLESEMSGILDSNNGRARRSLAAANLRLVVRQAAKGENDRDADIVHRRVLTRSGLVEEVDPPMAAADATIRAVADLIDDREVDRRYRALAASIAREGMLIDQDNAVVEQNGGGTMPWKELGIIRGARYDASTITLADLFAVPLSPTVERFYRTGYDRHEAMSNRIIEVAKNYLCELLDRTLAEGGVTRSQLALDIRFVRAWRALTRTVLATRIHVPMAWLSGSDAHH